MTITCSAPDETLGTVLRLSTYLDCQARALGENGFATLAGGPIVAGSLSAAITIFVALIGYRLILGTTPTLRDGVSLAVRLGLVLTLTASQPAFRTLVYDVATTEPVEIATSLMRSTGLPADDSNERLQRAYDVVAHGSYIPSDEPPSNASSSNGAAIPQGTVAPSVGLHGSPWAASLIALSSVGIVAALRLVTGLLIAIGPLAALALLFDATLGLFASWATALAGAVLGVAMTSIGAALEAIVVESEIARSTAIQSGRLAAGDLDVQAFATIGAIFSLIAIVLAYASFRAVARLRLPVLASSRFVAGTTEKRQEEAAPRMRPTLSAIAPGSSRTTSSQTRVGSVADALSSAAGRDSGLFAGVSSAPFSPGDPRRIATGRSGVDTTRIIAPLGPTARRTSVRRSLTAVRRDGV